MTVYRLGEYALQTEDEDYWIAPSAAVIGQVILKHNASVWWGAVLRGDNEPIIVGENSNIQDGCVLHTEVGQPCIVGRNVTVGHRAILHSAIIGDNCLIGMGCTIMDRAKIGDNCLIGANAFIPAGREIPANSVVLGAPGKVVRMVSPQEVVHFTGSAAGYINNWRRYKAGLAPDERYR